MSSPRFDRAVTLIGYGGDDRFATDLRSVAY
jgi:hypothetical protein